MSDAPQKLDFHDEAAKRYNEISREILPTVQAITPPGQHSGPTVDLHPSIALDPKQIIAFSKLFYQADIMGQTTGVTWIAGGRHVGWTGPAFKPIQDLVNAMETTKPFKGLVSNQFLLERTCEWLSEKSERKRDDLLSDHIARRAEESIQDHEIWIPVFGTFSSAEFSIGKTKFRTISREIMDSWWSRHSPDSLQRPEVVAAMNRKRSRLQGVLAACNTVRAEPIKAAELARGLAQDAVALLRFFSPANFSSRLRSYCTLMGAEAVGTTTEFYMSGGTIQRVVERAKDLRMAYWHLDASVARVPGLLSAIDALSGNASTELGQALLDALILYSRQSIASDISEKLVFTLAALESILLRDSSEPIQKNLGERMAFLVGNSIEERKEVVKNVEQVYRIRSAFVHHGQTPEYREVLDKFLGTAWNTFFALLGALDHHRTKVDLIGALDDRKMA